MVDYIMQYSTHHFTEAMLLSSSKHCNYNTHKHSAYIFMVLNVLKLTVMQFKVSQQMQLS